MLNRAEEEEQGLDEAGEPMDTETTTKSSDKAPVSDAQVSLI